MTNDYHPDGCGREEGERCTCNDLQNMAADLASGVCGPLEDLRSFLGSVDWTGPYAVRVNMARTYLAAALTTAEAAAATLREDDDR